jgi:SAM-dependent methyltransferase
VYEKRSARYDGFPAGFFTRSDEADDARFYDSPRIVTHIDDVAIATVSALYDELAMSGPGAGHQLDLMSSWVSHLSSPPDALTIVGMNATELDRNPLATTRVVLDLNATTALPFDDNTFDGAMCCVSVDYLTSPIEVFDEVARVLKPGRPFVCTFSNRCFPTKAITGWMQTDDHTHCTIVAEYFQRAVGFGAPQVERRQPPTHLSHLVRTAHDPLYAVWAAALG